MKSFLIIAILSGLFFPVSAQEGSKKVYPLVVKFTSIGTGVPSAKPITDFVKSFEKKYKLKKIKADTLAMQGREGEYSLAFSLAELSKTQKITFTREIKKVTKVKGDRGQIQYEENVKIDKSKTRGTSSAQSVKID